MLITRCCWLLLAEGSLVAEICCSGESMRLTLGRIENCTGSTLHRWLAGEVLLTVLKD